MKQVLLAAADRDLLACYQRILSDRFGETVTAFDGTQVFSLLGTGSFDLVILDEDLPRMDHQQLVNRINERNIPLIILTTGLRQNANGQTAHFLPFPFTPEEICAAAEGMFRSAEEKQNTLQESPEKQEILRRCADDGVRLVYASVKG